MPDRPASHFADRLLEAIDRCGAPACVGIDPVFDRLPEVLQRHLPTKVQAIERFSIDIVRAVAGLVPAVKPQSACFERYGAAGVLALERVCAEARDAGLLVILDAKRGDIGVTSEHYAVAAFEACDADAVTVSAYLGPSVVQSYFDTMDRVAKRTGRGRGLFVLVRTSNPDSDHVQSLTLEGGDTVAQRMADLVQWLGQDRLGERGYSDIGAVVAATKPDDAADLRRRLASAMLLVPGYGAQGGGVEDIRALFRKGEGAIVTASRSVIYAFDPKMADWAPAVRDAASKMMEELAPLGA